MSTQSVSLREYQHDGLNSARGHVVNGYRSILIQGVTGTGKTRMVASMTHRAITKFSPGQEHLPETKRKKQRVWFVVPRKELLWQSSKEFNKWRIHHGMISAKSKESAAFSVHICSRDTLIKRVREEKIKFWPDIIISDEAHIALDQWLEIKHNAPGKTIFIGFTATPERLDGRPLLGMYDVAVMGQQMQWFCEHGFLKKPWVLSVPPSERLEGLSELKTNKSGDVDAKKLLDLYKARAKKGNITYGDEIKHYQKFGSGRSFLVFCRNIKQAEQVAEEFTQAGHACESIDGKMTDKVRQEKIKKVERGVLLGLTTVDLCTYGLDVPKISCAILLRLTDSVSLFFQMIGRILRWDGVNETGLILDHVGNCDDQKHGHPLAPRAWNFSGTKKKKEKMPDGAVEKIAAVDKCKICYDLIIGGVCRTCKAEKEISTTKPMKRVEGWLVEIKEPTPLKERPAENQRHYMDMINNNIDEFKKSWYPSETEKGGVVNLSAVENLLSAAHDLKRQPMWVYHELTKNDLTVNVSLLCVIGEIKKYKPQWVAMKRQDLEKGLTQSSYRPL